MINIHPEGRNTIIFASLIFFSLEVSAAILLPLPLFTAATLGILGSFTLTFRFFRIPRREYIQDPDHILAPADGKIVAIETVTEKEYFKDERIQISIFMSIHNVHINRFPISGSVSYFKYHPGKYLLAKNPKSSELNEHTSVVIKGKSEILIRQIAGYVARRIICYANPHREVQQIEELGFIKFGSRVDIFLPKNSQIIAQIGDKTIGGITKLAIS